jgi:hypothetical protein
MDKKKLISNDKKIPWFYWIVWILGAIAIFLLIFQIIRTVL